MPSAVNTSENLLATAIGLRQLARRLEAAAVLDLHRRAGAEVWEGPTPRRCHEALLTVRRDVLAAADELRAEARALERRAAHAVAPTGTAR